jgi:cytochrome P450
VPSRPGSDAPLLSGDMTTHTAPIPSPFTEPTGTARHAAFAELAATGPVQRVMLFTGVPAWVVTGYAEARELLAHPDVVKRQGGGPHRNALSPDVDAAMNQHLLSTNPPDHTRLRRLVAKVFTARRIEELRPRVEQLSAALIARMAPEERTDLVEDYAVQLPIQVICELLGVPVEDQEDFRRWTGVMVAGSASTAGIPEAAAAFLGYLRDLIAHKRANPAGDLLSGLIATRDEGDRLTEDELTSMVFLLLLAGHETTVNLIGNGMYTLLTRPGEHRRLLADPGLIPAAVEEFLRLESPVETATFRIAVEPVTYGGVTIPRGSLVAISLLSADRDPARFPEPAAFDLGRPDNQHLAFGHGIHYCLGAPLARLEAQIAFTDLLAAFPDMRLDVPAEAIVWRPGVLIHGTTALPVRLKA